MVCPDRRTRSRRWKNGWRRRRARSRCLELKSDFSGNIALAAAVAAALGAYKGPVALKSFDPALIAVLRTTDAHWPLEIVAQEFV